MPFSDNQSPKYDRLTKKYYIIKAQRERNTTPQNKNSLDAVVDRFGTKDVQYAKVDDTHFSVTSKVEISDQFFGWILGFGKKAKLLYPDDVIEQFRGYMDKIREMY